MIVPDVHIKMNYYGKLIDFSDNSYPIRHYGLTQPTVPRAGSGKVSNYAMFFKGTSGQYAECSCGYKTPPFTVACWVNMCDYDGPVSYPIFWSFNLPYLGCDSSASPFRLSFKDSGGTQRHVTSTTVPTVSTWYHLVAIFDTDHVELWVNGTREVNDATYAPAAQTNYALFDIGRHYASNNYIIHGRIDDLRIYDSALSGTEIQAIIDIAEDNDPVRTKFGSDGKVWMQGMDEAVAEQDVEWALVDAFLSDATTDPDGKGAWENEDALSGQARINSTGELTAAGWTHSLTTINSGAHTLNAGFMQAYYSGGTTGYIRKYIDIQNYDFLRIRWGNWYTGTATIKLSIDGGVWVTARTLAASAGEDIFYLYLKSYRDAGYSTLQISVEEAGIFWISEMWYGKMKTPTTKVSVKNAIAQDIQIIPQGLSKNLVSYDDWYDSVGTYGDVGMFNCNGDQNENYRNFYQLDPWQNYRLLWRAATVGSPGAADGGWNTDTFSIDPDETYRFSVWMFCVTNATYTASRYFGTRGYGGTDGLYARDTGSLSTNPYFWSGSAPAGYDKWNLIVGHIWPRGSGTGSDHADSGIYDIFGSVGAINRDWVFHNDTLTTLHRAYEFYATGNGVITYFLYPTCEKCDGTEVPLEDLISGKAYERPFKPPQAAYTLGANVKQQIRGAELVAAGQTRFM